ncbi:uncharacterized protein LY89DRAFT_717366 [Mollisia scopiformis]|uniref:Actin-like ATPase domain-containing protein n=1 Tax=Mollisia scopiformis TaxID=149040 RepID=A0A194XFB1_MOLSC|nr:uncharacterized protein LY89DRAFT_717366 [Mollisia scopiformis]KUJ18836.1 hypothetical protein LY89DRAFT_717366 [Mollisia scopiformis]
MDALSEAQRRRQASRTFTPPVPPPDQPRSNTPRGSERGTPVRGDVEERRLVIAIDYGTTYTGVAIATPARHRASLEEVDIIQDWGHGMDNHEKIPSVISYSLAPGGEQQWGTNLSPEAIAMVHTKLQLDVAGPSEELELILQALKGMHKLDFKYIMEASGAPKYPCKGPEDIVTDYLTRVFENLLQALKKEPFTITDSLRRTMPVDIIATVPAKWGYRAKDSTFRALQRAGFNSDTFPRLSEMLLISEPEAAAIYTARYEKEKKGIEFLGKDESFVLCDAGGGTVDVVSYQVKQLQPTFEIEPVTLPTGKKCGSIFINLKFKEWLKWHLGEELYQELDQAEESEQEQGQRTTKISSHDSEGMRMRELMKRFDIQKRRFRNDPDKEPILINLPEPFEDLNLDDRVWGGQVTIPYKVMKSFFEPSANDIVQLIDGQREQIEKRRTRLRHVFLVGGFAESVYLQETIRRSLDMRRLDLCIPETSWTAVVRGAAIFGIEKSTNKTLTKMSACGRSYGISHNASFSEISHDTDDHYKDPLTGAVMARDQLVWLIKKDDLILSDKPKKDSFSFEVNFPKVGSRARSLPIYTYGGPRDHLPDRLSNAENELSVFHTIDYDLKDIPLQDFTASKSGLLSRTFYVAPMKLSITLTPQMVHLELHMNEKSVYSKRVMLDAQAEA